LSDSSPIQRAPAWVGAIPAALLIGVAALSLLGHPRRTHAPPEDDWRRAAAHVTDALAAGELFRVHPSWAETPLPYLTALEAQRSVQHHPTVGDLHGASAVLVLTEAERLGEALERLPFEADVASQESFGEVTVARVVVPGASRTRESLRAIYERTPARVQVVPKRGVRVSWREMADEQRRCIAVDLSADAPTTTHTFRGVPLSLTLRVRAGRDISSARLPVLPKTEQEPRFTFKMHGKNE